MRRCLLVIVLLAAPMSASAATRTFDVTAHQNPWKFDVMENGVPVTNWNVDQGDHVVIRIRSSDVTHGFTMQTYVADHTLGSTIQTIEFDAATSGSFVYACTVSSCGNGHTSMWGTFTVQGDDTSVTITQLSPTSGPTAGNTSVTIDGTGFEGIPNVKFGESSATNTVLVNTTKLTCTTPAHEAGTVDVVVTFTKEPDPYEPPYKSGIDTAAVKKNAFTFVGPSPVVSSVAPDSGPPDGGTAVIVTGTGFQSGATATFGGAAATGTTVASATQIYATTPAHSEGTVDVKVTNPDAQSGTKPGAFVYATVSEPLTIEGISPAACSPDGGISFTIWGTGFVAGATVTLGGGSATQVEVAGPTTITGVTPPHAVATVDVVVTNPDSSTAVMSRGFAYVTPSQRRRPIRRPESGKSSDKNDETGPN